MTDTQAPIRALFIDMLSYDDQQATTAVEALIACVEARYSLVERPGALRCIGRKIDREAIITAVRQLAREVKPDEAVLLYYAGHGGQAELTDRSGQLPLEWYALPWTFICPRAMSFRRFNPNQVLFVEELVALLRTELADKTSNLTLIFDCCHAGGMALPGLLPMKIEPAAISKLHADAFDRSLDRLAEYVCVQATGDSSKAYRESGSDDPLLTRALTEAIERSAPRTRPLRMTWASLLAAVRANLGPTNHQRPRVVGASGRLPFSLESVDTSTRLDYQADRARVSCGSFHGLEVGDRVEVIGPTRTHAATIVARPDPLEAELQFADQAPAEGHEAYLVASVRPEPISIEAEAETERVRLLRRAIDEAPQLRLADASERPARFHIRVEPDTSLARSFSTLVGKVRAARFAEAVEAFTATTSEVPLRLFRLSASGDKEPLVAGTSITRPSQIIGVERTEAGTDEYGGTLYHVVVLELRSDGTLFATPSLELPQGVASRNLGNWHPLTGRLYLLATTREVDISMLLAPDPASTSFEPAVLGLRADQGPEQTRDAHVHAIELELSGAAAARTTSDRAPAAIHVGPGSPEPRSIDQLLYRAQVTIEALDGWLHEDEFIERSRLDDSQARALLRVLADSCRTLGTAKSALEQSKEPRAQAAAHAILNDKLDELERQRALVRSILDQRRRPEHLGELQMADLCAIAGYADALCAPEQRTTTGPPLVVLEPLIGPAMSRPNTAVAVPSFIDADQRESLRLPLIYLPPAYLEAPWMLTTVQHEVGHYLDWLLDSWARLEPVVAKNVAGQNLDDWHRWLEEIIADIWGVVLGGEGFVQTLASLLLAHRASSSTTHAYPPTALRAHLLATTLAALGGPAHPATSQRLAGLTDIDWRALANHRFDADQLVGALLDAPLPVAGCRWRDVVDFQAEAEATNELMGLLKNDAKLSTALENFGPRQRLIPSAAQLALEGPSPCLATIAKRSIEAAHAMTLPDWVLDRDELVFLDELTQLRPTICIEDGEKKPPIQLLCAHDKLAFIGANNENLAKALNAAQDLRKRPWQSIEIFFLGPKHISMFPTKTGGTEFAREIAGLFNDKPWAQTWTLFEYDEPYLFGAFFDWGEPHGRIHTSSGLWGADLSDTPGLDIRRGLDATDRYTALVEALDSLRESSRVLHGERARSV